MLLLWIILIVQTSAHDENICRNQTILQTPGDALLTVFVDATFGPHCNESSSKGFQELTAALYVITTLNRVDYVPGITLGLKLIDTCQDPRAVWKHCMVLAADADCTDDYYSLGVLAPEAYTPTLRPLQDYTDLPLAFYLNENITKPLVNVAVDFISRKFDTIDLLLTDSDFTRETFADVTRDRGVCVRSVNNLTQLASVDGLVVAAAGEERIRSWIEAAGRRQRTWLILPVDDSEPDDAVPIGSYLVKSQSLVLDLEDYLTVGTDDALIHSPHLLSIGRSLVSVAELLADVQRNNCPSGVCSLPAFDARLLKKIPIAGVFDALQIPQASRQIRYVVSQRLDPEVDELEDVAVYETDAEHFHASTNDTGSQLTSCWSKNSCESCVNFGKKLETTEVAVEVATASAKTTLKTDYWVPVALVLIVLGTVVCAAVGGYILYRFFTEDVLDGNPTLTLLVVVGDIFILYTTLTFCLEEDVLGVEHLNSRRVFLITLACGTVFSIMLARSFFLAFSTGGVFTSHINGYLQGLMVFFMAGVQVGMSTLYFVAGPSNSGEILRSPAIIGLLSYDIFLLVTFLAVGVLINQIPRNYREGRCFFFTSIGLLVTWLIWIVTFLCVYVEWRSTVVAFGMISTAYVVIGGVLVPRVYYMVTHLEPDKSCPSHLEGAELGIEPRRRSIRQSRRPFYDYVLPMEGVRNTGGLNPGRNPNFYGSSSPAHRRQQSDGGISNPVNTKACGYNNYGYHAETQESENHYVVPRVCIIQTDDKKRNRSRSADSDYAQPTYTPEMKENSLDDDCLETEIYVEGRRLSPSRRGPNESYPSRSSSPRLYQTEATIDEEDEEADQEVTKVTRF